MAPQPVDVNDPEDVARFRRLAQIQSQIVGARQANSAIASHSAPHRGGCKCQGLDGAATQQHIGRRAQGPWRGASHGRGGWFKPYRSHRGALTYRPSSGFRSEADGAVKQALVPPAHPAASAGEALLTEPKAFASGRFPIDVHGVRYEVSLDGSRLKRIEGKSTRRHDPWTLMCEFPDAAIADAPTPNQVMTSGVTFYLNPDGYLYREAPHRGNQRPMHKSTECCPAFSQTGRCAKGRECRFTHDPNRVAICKEFVKGHCKLGEACNRSHEPTPHRMPACQHYQRGRCTRADCIFAHVDVSPDATACHDFGKYGYCVKGEACPHHHSWECVEYANTGACSNSSCRLLHVDVARRLRQGPMQQQSSSENVGFAPQQTHGDEDAQADYIAL